MYKEVQPMRTSIACPVCGSIHDDHQHIEAGAEAAPDQRDVRFAKVLNGRQWRDKPLAPPRNRDDIVPND
jgi:hypothetical protein